MLWDWRDTGTPPHAGGLADQPAGLLRRAKYLEAVYNVMRRFYTQGVKGMGRAESDILKRVLELRRQRGDTR